MFDVTIRQKKLPTFNGKHNEVRSKVLLILLEYKLNYKYGSGLPARNLSILSGCSYRTILCSCTKWTKWRYVLRSHCYGYYHYRIGKRGEAWLTRHIKALRLPLALYLEEIEEAQSRYNPLIKNS